MCPSGAARVVFVAPLVFTTSWVKKSLQIVLPRPGKIPVLRYQRRHKPKQRGPYRQLSTHWAWAQGSPGGPDQLNTAYRYQKARFHRGTRRTVLGLAGFLLAKHSQTVYTIRKHLSKHSSRSIEIEDVPNMAEGNTEHWSQYGRHSRHSPIGEVLAAEHPSDYDFCRMA